MGRRMLRGMVKGGLWKRFRTGRNGRQRMREEATKEKGERSRKEGRGFEKVMEVMERMILRDEVKSGFWRQIEEN